MGLDATHSERYVKKSLIRYFVDSLEFEKSVNLRFDASLEPIPTDSEQWAVIHFGALATIEPIAEIYCCTRNDPEGLKLSVLRDSVMDCLTEFVSNIKSIPIYNTDTQPWSVINYAVVKDTTESEQPLNAPDGTKYRVITVRFWIPIR